MLDFLLLRPEDRPLWAGNSPDTLRYLALDELHTYDGAQGSDVAGLIRRLQARLDAPAGAICPVGTSATVGDSTPASLAQLVEFATQIFGAPIPPEAVIGETRLTLAEFIPAGEAEHTHLPADTAALAEQPGESYDDFLTRQLRLWFDDLLDPPALGEALKRHSLLPLLLTATQDAIRPWADITADLTRLDPTLAAHPNLNRLLRSFLALIAQARVNEGTPEQPWLRQLLSVQTQLWIREMSRLLRTFGPTPDFFWFDDALDPDNEHGLPPYFCRECGHTGWLTFISDGDSRLNEEIRDIYRRSIERHKSIRYVYPDPARTNPTPYPPPATRHPSPQNPQLPGMQSSVCPQCLVIRYSDHCSHCGIDTLPVIISHEVSQPDKGQPQDLQRCPACGTDNALSIVGAQAASLSSVAISHLFTTPLNTDKKLLAFTDSVQDAAHRAAFFGARTYRFGLRTATQAALEAGTGTPRLSDFTERLLTHWQQQWADDQKLIATFFPPDLRDRPAYRAYMDAAPGPIPPELDRELRRRLSWEVTMEYGFNARLGRSLEKVGSSAAYPDPDLLAPVVDQLALILPEELAALRGVDRPALHYFVLGLLDRTRLRGGVDHPLLGRYLYNQGLWYMLTKNIEPLLSPFHKRSRLPKFLTDRAERGVFDLFVSGGKRPTWYADWASRALPVKLNLADSNELYRRVIEALTEAAILRAVAGSKATAYGLRPQSLLLNAETAGLRCDACGHRHTVTPAAASTWRGAPCLSYRCAGHYRADDQSGQHYYRQLYRRGQVERIFSLEHTGLLDRDTREATETQFKSQRRADAANLLTATPTLEMGIDVGDLSATMACSVPPATANYLQRIGRAGRETGNSLVLALANTKPHDLYFFEEPLEMIAGAITPPGCYLDAPDMLKRQFLAFCMDTWVVADPAVRPLPRDVRGMLSGYQRGGFPENLLAYFLKHHESLLARFLALFGTDLSPETQAALRDFAESGALPAAVRQAVTEAEAEREQLRRARRRLKQRRDKIEADPAQYQDPEAELKKVAQEMKLIVSLIKMLEDKYILNFFTDAGLLPNYAFPESGVRLNAVVTGLETTGDDGKSYTVTEYLRAAAVAIRELAPFNRFYAQGRKLPINFIELGSAAESVERWQFCDRCTYMERVQTSHYKKTCPQCGSPIWSDKGQQRDMLRLRRVTARTDHFDSQLGDDADEREREFYHTGLYLESYRRPANMPAQFIPDAPFGFEYLDVARLREINYGRQDTLGPQLVINAEERPADGYKVCRDCGLVVTPQQELNGQSGPQHAARCLSRTSGREPEWAQLFLYRELQSEALRLLLPVSTVFVEEKLATFTAAMRLGLKRYLRGAPDHLQIMAHSEPTADHSRRHYLVIYDTVPGGTSLLRHLARPENFFELLHLAQVSLTSCDCRHHPAKKACYRCLYNYRHQYQLDLIDRQLAVDMLGDILARRGDLEEIGSLSDVHLDDLVESELEQRFVEALAGAVRQQGGTWQPAMQHGKKAWEFSLHGRRWLLEPQVTLDHAHGVTPTSRPDFVCWPQPVGETRPVAIFTDGLAYHARPQQPVGRLGDDLQKRQAILASGKFRVWSVTWDDVEALAEDKGLGWPGFLGQAEKKTLKKLLPQANPLPPDLVNQPAATTLLVHLQHPQADTWQDYALALVSSLLDVKRPPIPAQLAGQLRAAMQQEAALPLLNVPPDTPRGDCFYHILTQADQQLLLTVPLAALQKRQAAGFAVTLRLDDTQARRVSDDFGRSWHQFWLLHNLLQFLPDFLPLTTELVLHHSPAAPTPATVTEASTGPELTPDWADAFELAALECHPLLQDCLKAAKPAPIVGYELAGPGGRVLSEAELAWEAQQVAILLPGDDEARAVFAAAGWQVFAPADQSAVLDRLMSG
ncbi:MAG: DEAD/DEAH box helicase [Anaerolineae bacterium]